MLTKQCYTRYVAELTFCCVALIVTVWTIFETWTHSFRVLNDWINPLHIFGNQNQYFLRSFCRHNQLFTLILATRSHPLQWRLCLVSEFPATLFFLGSNLTWTVRQLWKLRRIGTSRYDKWMIETLLVRLSSVHTFNDIFLMNRVRLKRNSGEKTTKKDLERHQHIFKIHLKTLLQCHLPSTTKNQNNMHATLAHMRYYELRNSSAHH